MYVVADASVFIVGKLLKGEVITVPSVEQELKDLRSKIKFEIANVRIEAATSDALRRAREAARETGDLPRLSETDLEVLAKAIEYGATLATDDYALQNVAVHLGLKVEPVAQRGIKRFIKRTQRCAGCGRAFEGDICPVCGTPPRKRKKGW